MLVTAPAAATVTTGPGRARLPSPTTPRALPHGGRKALLWGGSRGGPSRERAATSIAGFFCMEWGNDSGSCQRGQEPSYPEANAYVIDETTRQLVGYMTPLLRR